MAIKKISELTPFTGPIAADDYLAIVDTSGNETMRIEADQFKGDQGAAGNSVTTVAVANIDDPSSELLSVAGVGEGDPIVVYEKVAATGVESTLYVWNDSAPTPSEDIPYIVTGDGGFWVATAGKYKISTTPTNKVETIYKIGNPDHIDTLDEIINHTWSAGVVHECVLSDNGDGTVDIGSGYAVLRPSASGHVALISIEVNAQAGISLTDGQTNYVYLDYNAGSPQFVASTSPTSFNCLDKCLTYVVHREGNNLDIINASEQTVDSNRKNRVRYFDINRFTHAAGGSLLGESGTRSLTLTSGAFYFMVQKIPHPSFDTNASDTFTYYYHVGGVLTAVPSTTQINNLEYNNGTDLTSMGSNNFRVDDVYIINNNPSTLAIVMGQAEYNTEAAAEASPIAPIVPNRINGMGALVGRVIIQRNAATFTEILSAFTQSFVGAAPSNHENLAGLQGGTLGEHHHLTLSEYNAVKGITKSALAALEIDMSGDKFKTKTIAGISAFTIANPVLGAVVQTTLTGDFTITLPATVENAASVVDSYDGTKNNLLSIECVDEATPIYWASIMVGD